MQEREGSELSITIPEDTRSGRADKLLAALVPDLSRSRWQKLLARGLVWKDECAVSQADRLRPGDSLEYRLPAPEPLDLTPVDMQLDILYEDDDLLVLNKAPGVVVHPGAGTGKETLVHGLLHHCRGSLSGIGGVERPGIVHRLDRETSGVLVVAKSDSAHKGLARQFAERTTRKRYLSLLAGTPAVSSGRIEKAIGRHPVYRTRMACSETGRPARSEYRLVQRWGERVSLVEVAIHTGRTHQIRVHMQSLGLPLLGDPLYGFKEKAFVEATGVRVPRVMLHAACLTFHHPADHRELSFEAPLAEDFRAVMRELDQLAAPVKCR